MLMEKDIELRIEGFSFYPIFFFHLMLFFLFSPPSLSLDRIAILATMPRIHFRVARNDDHRVSEITH